MQVKIMDNHQKFLEHLTASEETVAYVAKWLESMGYNVTIKPLRRSPTSKEWQEYVDDGDLEIRLPVEVKCISRNFTGRRDWPFGDEFIVCARHSFDRYQVKPLAYVIVSADHQCFAVVETRTFSQWKVVRRGDRRYGEQFSQEFYLCPLELVKWFQTPA